MSEKSVGRERAILPPGPWLAKGDKVFAGNNVVAVVVCAHANEVAEALAQFPDRSEDAADAANASLAAREAEEAGDENARMESEVERLSEERDLMAERVAQMSEVIAMLRGQLARLKKSPPSPV